MMLFAYGLRPKSRYGSLKNTLSPILHHQDRRKSRVGSSLTAVRVCVKSKQARCVLVFFRGISLLWTCLWESCAFLHTPHTPKQAHWRTSSVRSREVGGLCVSCLGTVCTSGDVSIQLRVSESPSYRAGIDLAHTMSRLTPSGGTVGLRCRMFLIYSICHINCAPPRLSKGCVFAEAG